MQGSEEEAVQPSRRLLATALANQADVNYQFMAFTANNVAAVQAELANVIKNSTGGPSEVPVSHPFIRGPYCTVILMPYKQWSDPGR